MIKIFSKTIGRIIELVKDQIKRSWAANANRLDFRVEVRAFGFWSLAMKALTCGSVSY